MHKYLALSTWWDRHNKSFSTWYLTLPPALQEALILNASPDIPRQTPATRESSGVPLAATDMLLPKLSLEALMAEGGKLLVLLFARRLVSTDGCITSDVKLLEDCFRRGSLPKCYAPETDELLKTLDNPFVDPTDINESIKSLTPQTSATVREELARHFEVGRLVRAEVWIAMKIRKSSLENFMEFLIMEHENAASPKLAPSYQSYLRSEKAQESFVVVDTEGDTATSPASASVMPVAPISR